MLKNTLTLAAGFVLTGILSFASVEAAGTGRPCSGTSLPSAVRYLRRSTPVRDDARRH